MGEHSLNSRIGYIPANLRLHFGRELAAGIDQGYSGSCIDFCFERYTLYAEAMREVRPGLWLLSFSLWDDARDLGWHFLRPDEWDLTLYGASDCPVPIADVGRLVEVSPCLPAEWRMQCSLDVLRSLSCTLDVRRKDNRHARGHDRGVERGHGLRREDA